MTVSEIKDLLIRETMVCSVVTLNNAITIKSKVNYNDLCNFIDKFDSSEIKQNYKKQVYEINKKGFNESIHAEISIAD